MKCEGCERELSESNPGTGYQYTVKIRTSGVVLETRMIYLCSACEPDHEPWQFEVVTWPEPIDDLVSGGTTE